MFDIDTIVIFCTASILLGFAPGPDNIFVLTQSIMYGKKAGLFVTFGLATGLIVHTTVVAFGLAAIFQTSVLAFNILKYLGVLYLLYLAWKAFKDNKRDINKEEVLEISSLDLYKRGIIMNITNPKVSIFFMAFLPQFTNHSNGSLTIQFILLGLVFILTTLFVFGFISFIAGVVGEYILNSKKFERILNYTAGSVFVGLALKLALTEK